MLDLDLATSPESPSLATTESSASNNLFILLILQLESVATHTSRVVIERDMSVLAGHKTVGNEMPHHPALHTSSGGIYSGILETSRAVASPVMGCLRRRRRHRRGLDATVGGRVGELDWVWGREVEVGRGLGGCIGADEVEGLVTPTSWRDGVCLCCTTETRTVVETGSNASTVGGRVGSSSSRSGTLAREGGSTGRRVRLVTRVLSLHVGRRQRASVDSVTLLSLQFELEML